ncbi:uncharacterized protein LOC114331115 isoform X2 [Diabrotica virgifera virgifera]|uniref:Uncharacterized protein n=1 Tax=Diabrotica virgifera virgifera TaxID=50390 RepID=A0ABM5K655_DIAVI|nr:uncharacterized protein LOC114331115 isoform X2 [Diabrotica virgifera virgifera]XP_050505671.1 uncharacterized protein LOC114331115 isoform X2 [Diabrotica virgifera virgifera]
MDLSKDGKIFFERIVSECESHIKDKTNKALLEKITHGDISENEVCSNHLPVPPSTPSNLIQDYEVTPVPARLPKLTKNPWVRKSGVKETIKRLAEVYGCKQFQYNLIQFWFLDFLADCLWRVQDEYQFNEKQQQVVLDWVIFVFNLIRAPDLKLSRKQLIKIFSEAINVAEHHIETGASSIPPPEELFSVKKLNTGEPTVINEKENESGSGSSICSSLEEKSGHDDKSYLAIELDQEIKYYDIPSRICQWDTDDEDLSSSVETMSEDEAIILNESISVQNNVDEKNVDLMYEDFYQPDLSTPPRFKESSESSTEITLSSDLVDESSDNSIAEEEQKEDANSSGWFIPKKKIIDVSCPSKVFDVIPEEKSEEQMEDEILKSWYEYHLWQLRIANMNDPNTGWLAASDLAATSSKMILKKPTGEEAKEQLTGFLLETKKEIKDMQRNQFVNTCVLMAIKQIVNEFFLDSFQFCVLKVAFRYTHYLITQELNSKWNVPKRFKGEHKRPMPKKMKKPKVPKSKKKAKITHKTKSTRTKSSRASKKSKASKARSDKKSKKGKNHKKEKSRRKLTKQEKAELARQEAKRKLYEEMERKAEENKRFMFPLVDSVGDKFFENIFENWVNPKKKRASKSNKDKTKKNKKKGKKHA